MAQGASFAGASAGKAAHLRLMLKGHTTTLNHAYKRCFNGGNFVLDEWNSDATGEFFVHTRVMKLP